MLTLSAGDRSKMLDAIFNNYRGPAFGVRLWDGGSWNAAGGDTQCVLVFHSPSSLEALLAHPSELTLGESFLAGEIDVEGDLFAVFEVAEHVFRRPEGRRRRLLEALSRVAFAAIHWLKEGATHSNKRDKAAISHHYDQPAEFFQPWLGDCFVYSCAYFMSADDGLATAQENKLELICRKLRLRHEDRFLDIGCGWGSLILHAASRHDVYSQGITISREQAAVAAARIEAACMTQSCRVDLMDYRAIPEHFATFDKIASIGMFEHVGAARLPEYFHTVHRMLRPGGVFLNHGIARAPHTYGKSKERILGWIERLVAGLPMLRRARRSPFIDKYVFPDGELCTLTEAITAAEKAGFEVRDVENLREHYELTLRAWVENLQRCKQQIIEQFSERTYRIWLLYMAGSAAAFRRGEIAVYQMLMCRPNSGKSGLPLTRHDWYQEPKEKHGVKHSESRHLVHK